MDRVAALAQGILELLPPGVGPVLLAAPPALARAVAAQTASHLVVNQRLKLAKLVRHAAGLNLLRADPTAPPVPRRSLAALVTVDLLAQLTCEMSVALDHWGQLLRVGGTLILVERQGWRRALCNLGGGGKHRRLTAEELTAGLLNAEYGQIRQRWCNDSTLISAGTIRVLAT